jgi:hypothetical protein
MREGDRHEPPGPDEERLAGRGLIPALGEEEGEDRDLDRRPPALPRPQVLAEEGDGEEHEKRRVDPGEASVGLHPGEGDPQHDRDGDGGESHRRQHPPPAAAGRELAGGGKAGEGREVPEQVVEGPVGPMPGHQAPGLAGRDRPSVEFEVAGEPRQPQKE